MNKSQAEIAVAALRSGKYKQYRNGIGHYRINNLCCIGVAAKANGCEEFIVTGNAATFLKLTNDQKYSLVKLNDVTKKSFAEIADWIEQQEWDTNEQSSS